MEKNTLTLFIIFFTLIISISIINGTRQEKEVTYQLIEKEQNALYRLQTYAMIAIEGMTDPWGGAKSTVELEILHIENGI